jgi:Zn-dependent protease with chaperone function
MPAGTNARFALLVVLALVTSAKMVLEFAFSITGQRILQCDLAAGVDVYRPGSDLNAVIARVTQYTAYTNCESRVAAPPPWWLPAGWPLLVLVLAVLLFHAERWWKLRGMRVRPLAEWDEPRSGVTISDEVRRLARDAGLVTVPRCVVDLTTAARSATVLGSSRRPVLCLYFGLVARRLELAAEGADGDPEFRAVLLHEFAHIRYGDVTAARATMAVWRAFLIAALAPYLVISAILVAHGSVWPGLGQTGPVDQRDFATTLALVALGYLARSDVLRNREIYADREAGRSGAEFGWWSVREEESPSWIRRAARVMAEPWRSHPGWDLRARSLGDPVALFVVAAMPVFLAGAAAALVFSDFEYVIQAYGQNSTWLGASWVWQGAGALSAALVTLVAGVALWRAVAYARQTGTAAPRVLRTGLWLGAGMIAGDLAGGQGTFDQLVSSRPELFLLVLAAGAAFAWWTVQCAGAWLIRWQGRITRLAMTVGLTGGFLILSWWFAFWANVNATYATGFSYSPSGYRRFLLYEYAGPPVHPDVLTAISWVQPLLNPLKYPPADLLAVGAAWVVPLLAWTIRPGAGPAGGQPPSRLPSLRGPLGWAAAGAVATWACVAWVQAYMHQTQPARPQLHGIYELTYFWFLLAAQAAPAAAVALVVGLRRGRFRLLVTLIATEVAVLAGFAGTLALVSADGCVRPLATLETSCAWRPGLMEWGYTTQADIPAVLGAVVAFAICALALIRPAMRKDDHRGRTGLAAPPAPRTRAYRGAPAVAAAAALGIALAGIVMQFPQQTHFLSPASQAMGQIGFELAGPTVNSPPPTPQVAALEVEEWSNLGGEGDLSRVRADASKISSIMKTALTGKDKHLIRDFLDIGPLCADIVAVSGRARGYFVVPDSQSRSLWSEFMNKAGAGGRSCDAAISLLRTDIAHRRAGEAGPFLTDLVDSLAQVATAKTDSEKIETRIKAVEETGVAAAYGNSIASPGPLGILPLPYGSTPWSDNTGKPMNLGAFVQAFYVRSAWTDEKRALARWGFVSGAHEGWDHVDGSGESIFIARFSGVNGAMSWFEAHTGYLRRARRPATALTDRADGGVGSADPTLDNQGQAKVQMVARVGDYVIVVQEFTAAKPDPAAAKALLLKQYDSLKKTA